MDPKHQDLRVEDWSAAALNAQVERQLHDADGAIDVTAFDALARQAEARAAEGKAEDASRLALLLLHEEGPIADKAEDPEDAAGLAERAKLARWRMLALMRGLGAGKAALKSLRAADRKAIQNPSLPLDPDELAKSEPSTIAAMVAGIDAQNTLSLLDGLWSLLRGAEALEAAGDGIAALVAARSGLELIEHARIQSDAVSDIVADFNQRLGAIFAHALGALGADDAAYKEALDWLLKSKSGQPRLSDFPAAALEDRDREVVLTRLQKKASKSAGFRRALISVGEKLLSRDDYLALCQELEHPRGVVTTLLAQGKVEQAAVEATKAIEADDAEWSLAKLFEEQGRTDLAIDMLTKAAEDTVNSDLELWLADRLEARGDATEAVAVFRRRFEKRPALPQFQALRDRVKKKAWPALREELITELRDRRLHRPLLDIASDEEDVDLLLSVAPELDDDQAVYAEQSLRSWAAASDAPKVAALLEQLEKRNDKSDQGPITVTAAEPVPEVVSHKKFGRGKVVGWSGEGEQRKLEIEFESVGRKVLLGRFVTVES